MAKQNSTPAKAGTVNTSENLLAELEEAQAGAISVSTNIQVEDRTDAPVDELDVEYKVTTEDLGTGIVLTTYGDAVSA